MKVLDQLNDIFLGERLSDWLLFVIIITLAILFARPISVWISRLLLKIANPGYLDDKDQRSKVRRPITRFIFSCLLYIAFHQLKAIPSLRILHYAKSKSHQDNLLLGDVVDKLLLLIIIVQFATIVIRLGNPLFKRIISHKESQDQDSNTAVLPFLQKAFVFIVWLITIFVILGSVLSVNIPALIASFGIGGVAIALAAKETVENTFATFVIMFDKPFSVGESIRVSGIEGTVEKIGFRSTRIRTAGQTVVIIPNKKMVDGNLENLSERGKQKLNLDFYLDYNTSPEQIESIIQSLHQQIKNLKHVVDGTTVYLSSLDNHQYTITIGCFIEHPLSTREVNLVRQQINLYIIDTVKKENAYLSIPVSKSL